MSKLHPTVSKLRSRGLELMALVALTLLVGACVFALLWWCGWLQHAVVAPDAAAGREATEVIEIPVVGQLTRPDENELREQQDRRERVRERCDPAATTLVSADFSTADARADALSKALGVLQGVIEENERDGALGVIASTELCNVLLAVDALKSLERLQHDADPTIAACSTVVFQHVIPRIWSF